MRKITLLALLILGACTSFYGQSSLCENAQSINLPYSTTDNTAYYANNYGGVPGSSCGGSLSFLYGNDVVYAYTATFDGSINVMLSTTFNYVGLFVYDSCSQIGQSCITGVTNQEITEDIMSIEDLEVEQGTTYYFVISSAEPVASIIYSLNIAADTCQPPSASYTVVSDCAENPQFLVDVNVEDLGSANSLTIEDSYGNEQSVATIGTFTFGPYTNGSGVLFTVSNDQDPNCAVTSTMYSQQFCAPENNFCSAAIDLATTASPLTGTTLNATSQNIPSCSPNMQSGDVYYSIDVPNGSTLSISETQSNYESVVSIFLGDCEDMLYISCVDYGDKSYTYFNDTGEDRTLYWVQDGYNGQTGNFTLEWSITDCVLHDVQYTIEPYCDEGPQFLVNAQIYSLGSASSLTIADNLGGTAQSATETGVLQFGPYDNFTEVVFTATNDGDSNCFTTSPSMVQYYCPPCTNAQAEFNIVLDCGEVQGYFVNVNVWDMGSADSITIADDQGNSESSITGTGVYQFGPYLPLSQVAFTISDDDDTNCTAVNYVQSYSACPPANDNCADAILLTVGANLDSAGVEVTSLGASTSPEEPTPSCGELLFTTFGKDIWYTVVVPESGKVTIETTGQTAPAAGILTDSVLQVYSGDCSGLTAVDCNNDTDTGTYSKVSLTDRAPGEVLYVRVFGFYGSSGVFTIGAYDDSICLDPTVSYEFELDCSTTPAYFIVLNLENMGSAGSLTIADDQETGSQNVNSTGSYQFGPYPQAIQVTFTFTNNDNNNCVLTETVQSSLLCPPSNDDCEAAQGLTVGTDAGSASILTSTLGATLSAELPIPECGNSQFTELAKDVWFTAITPASGSITIETMAAGNLNDTVLQIYEGSCDSLSPLSCDDDGGIDDFARIDLSGLTPGEVLYIRAFGFEGSSGMFYITAYDGALSSGSFDYSRMSVYPNPVKDYLNLSSAMHIDAMSIYTLLGQEVFSRGISDNHGKVDISGIAEGVYILRVIAGGRTESFKIIKE